MKELQFETGVVTYKVNGSCEISFNPADPFFAKKLFDAIDRIGARQEEIEKKIKAGADGKEFFDFTEQEDTHMREEINGIFGKPVCGSLFHNVCVWAIAGGFPLWANFLMALVDEIDNNLVQEEKKSRERLNVYMEKYKRYSKR